MIFAVSPYSKSSYHKKSTLVDASLRFKSFTESAQIPKITRDLSYHEALRLLGHFKRELPKPYCVYKINNTQYWVRSSLKNDFKKKAVYMSLCFFETIPQGSTDIYEKVVLRFDLWPNLPGCLALLLACFKKSIPPPLTDQYHKPLDHRYELTTDLSTADILPLLKIILPQPRIPAKQPKRLKVPRWEF